MESFSFKIILKTSMKLCKMPTFKDKSLKVRTWEIHSNMATSDQQNIDLTKEFSLLPAVYDILKSIEKTNDSQEVTRKVSCVHLIEICYWIYTFISPFSSY